jgi:RimJ/RimL family protein N-acetyltransferase
MMVAMPIDPPLFQAAGHSVRQLEAADIPTLQALFDANPAYFQTVNGRPAQSDEAQAEFDEVPPAHLPFAAHWKAAICDGDGQMVGTLVVLSDFCAAGVWHLGLFLLATRLHGSGLATAVHRALLDWARTQGAQWMRLSVIVGNARAERFWERQGYAEVRRRLGIDTGGRRNDARVMVKALGHLGLDDYLVRVPRDHPGSDLP